MKDLTNYRWKDEDELREFVAASVNQCFDDAGKTLLPEAAPVQSLLATPPDERAELLEKIVESLPLSRDLDWSQTRASASLRAHCMLVEACYDTAQWERCLAAWQSLQIDWATVPADVIGIDVRAEVCSAVAHAWFCRPAPVLAHIELGIDDDGLRLDETIVDVRPDYSSAIDEAHRLATSLLAVSRGRSERADTHQNRRDVALSLECLGTVERTWADGSEENSSVRTQVAYDRFCEALNLRRQLFEADATPCTLRDLARVLRSISFIEKHGVWRGNLEHAWRRRSELLDVEQHLAEQLGTDESRLDVVNSLMELGDIEVKCGRQDSAAGRYSKELEIRRTLAQKLATHESLKALSDRLGHFGRSDARAGDLERAWRRCSEKLEIDRQLAKGLSTDQRWRHMAKSLGQLGDVEAKQGELQYARSRFSEALGISEDAAKVAASDDPEVQDHEEIRRIHDFQRHFVAYTEDPDMAGDTEIARVRFTAQLDFFRQRARDSGAPSDLQDVSDSLSGLGGVEEAHGDLERAWACHFESLEIHQRLAKEEGWPTAKWNVAVSLERIGNVEEARGDLAGALGRYAASLKVLQGLADELRALQSRDDLQEVDPQEVEGQINALRAKLRKHG